MIISLIDHPMVSLRQIQTEQVLELIMSFAQEI